MSGTSSDKGRVASVPSACSSPGARIPASSGAPAGLGNDGSGGGRGDRMLSGTCGICRDGIPREPALGDPPLPVAAVVWLGGPSPRWGSARWVSAPRDLWACHFLGLGRPEVPRGAWEWRGPAWGLGSGSGGGAAPAVCGRCSDPRGSASGAPSPAWHCSSVWFLFLRLLLGRAFCGAPHPHLAQSWVPQTLPRRVWIRP